jgi:hypothetical protein
MSGLVDAQIFDKAMANIKTSILQTLGIFGSVMVSILVGTSMLVMFGKILIQRRAIRFTTYSVLFLLISIPFIVPVVFLRTLQSKVEDLPPWIEVTYGDVYKLLIGSLGCVVSVGILGWGIQYIGVKFIGGTLVSRML